MGQTATFSVTAVGSGLNYQWQKGSTAIAGATFASYTTPPASTFDSGSKYSVVVRNSGGSVTSNAATLAVKSPASTDVLTYHNDAARTGQNLTETALTPSNVTAAKFGKLGFYPVDGLVDAEPLYASNVTVAGNGTHNLLIAATESDSVYAFDADSGATIWHASVLKPGETASPDPPYPTNPWIGVNATPVIDRTSGPNGAIYVVASSALTQNGETTYYQRLHALDLALGTELFGGPVDIQATYPGTGDNSDGTNVIFDPGQYRERVSLLLLNGVVYMAWSSHYDIRPYTGWIMGYSESTLAQTSVLNVTPNGNQGAIWMSGGGLAADPSGNIYFLDSNGTFDSELNSSGFPHQDDYGNAFLKLSTSSKSLSVADYFVMDNEASENDNDIDLGSGGTVVLPDLLNSSGQPMHLAVGAGKDAIIYLVNRDSMGKSSENNSNIYQQVPDTAGTGFLNTGLFQQHDLLRIVGRPHRDVHLQQREARGQRYRKNHHQLRLSRSDPEHFGQWYKQRYRVGRREHYPGGPARLQRGKSERTLQHQPGQRRPRPVRRRQQIHNANDRERQSLRRHAQRSGRLRPIAVAVIVPIYFHAGK